MKIWFIHHYATLPNLNGHIRPYKFGCFLRPEHESVIIASSFQHFSNTDLIDGESKGAKYIINDDFDIPYVFIKTPSSESGGLARVRNMYAFYRGIMAHHKALSKKLGKPDVIVASSPQPLDMLAGIRLAKKYGVPCICEVRDLWPEAIFTATRLKETGVIGKLLTKGEHSLYRRSDAIIFTKEGDTDYIKEHGWSTMQGGDIDLNKCFYINNGVDLQEYERRIVESAFADDDLDSDKFKVIYAGAIRPVNNVGNILDAAKQLAGQDDIVFLIYGDGSERAALEKRAAEENITNVRFKGFVDKKFLPYIMSRSSLNLLNYSGTKYNWTRGNSSNKLFEYLASGKPVVSTVKMGYSIINKYDCGIELDNLSPEALANAVLSVKGMDEQSYRTYCGNAKAAAQDFDYKRLTERLASVLDAVAADNR